jgi:hypothetical protein
MLQIVKARLILDNWSTKILSVVRLKELVERKYVEDNQE